MRSAVRLFCFLIGMVFQQIPPLLLLVSYYLFLLLVCVTRICGNEGGGCYPYMRKSAENVLPVYAWKTQPNHTSLWKKAIYRL